MRRIGDLAAAMVAIALALLAGAVVGVSPRVASFARVRPSAAGGVPGDAEISRSGPTADTPVYLPERVPAAAPSVDQSRRGERRWIAIATALAFAVVAWRTPSPWVVPAYWVLTGALVQVSAVDIDEFRIPRRVVYATWLLGAPLLVVASAGTGRWGALSQVVVAGVASIGAFGVLHVAGRGGLGFGDVRLAGLCGGFLGWSGYRVALAGLLLAFVAGGLVAGVLVAARGTARDHHLPFAPMLAIGTVAALALGAGSPHLLGT